MKRIFFVKAAQQDQNNPEKRYYNDVGTLVMHENEAGTGTLFLNHLPGIPFAVFPKKEEDKAKGPKGE
jgi:hypothetical protein